MDQVNQDNFVYWQGQASRISSNIFITSYGGWLVGDLLKEYDEDSRGTLNLPTSLPVYKVSHSVKIKTGEVVFKSGIYIPSNPEASAQLLIEGYEAIEAYIGLDPETDQFISQESVEWMLVERVGDEGGSAENIQVENLKGYAGEMCQRSGDWYSPANQSQSRYFEQGEIFPEIANNAWGETIWYLEVTNKN